MPTHPAYFAPFSRATKFNPYHFEPAAPEVVYRTETSQQRRAKARTTDRRALRALKQQPAVLVALPITPERFLVASVYVVEATTVESAEAYALRVARSHTHPDTPCAATVERVL